MRLLKHRTTYYKIESIHSFTITKDGYVRIESGELFNWHGDIMREEITFEIKPELEDAFIGALLNLAIVNVSEFQEKEATNE